jgi:hypothetical protein
MMSVLNSKMERRSDSALRSSAKGSASRFDIRVQTFVRNLKSRSVLNLSLFLRNDRVVSYWNRLV